MKTHNGVNVRTWTTDVHRLLHHKHTMDEEKWVRFFFLYYLPLLTTFSIIMCRFMVQVCNWNCYLALASFQCQTLLNLLQIYCVLKISSIFRIFRFIQQKIKHCDQILRNFIQLNVEFTEKYNTESEWFKQFTHDLVRVCVKKWRK